MPEKGLRVPQVNTIKQAHLFWIFMSPSSDSLLAPRKFVVSHSWLTPCLIWQFVRCVLHTTGTSECRYSWNAPSDCWGGKASGKKLKKGSHSAFHGGRLNWPTMHPGVAALNERFHLSRNHKFMRLLLSHWKWKTWPKNTQWHIWA